MEKAQHPPKHTVIITTNRQRPFLIFTFLTFLSLAAACGGPLQRTLCGGPSTDLQKCNLKNGQGSLEYVELIGADGDTTCEFYDGAPEDLSTEEGRWGTYGDILWTKGPCRGIFEFCTSGINLT